MPSITLVIKMTGLLLLTPDNRVGDLPMHVITPTTGHMVPAHVAQVGFRTRTPQDCLYQYDYAEQICYVNMDGWAMELGRIGTNGRQPPPSGAAKLSNATYRVIRGRLGQNPGRTVRSRVTLHSGGFIDHCSAAPWSFGGQTINLVNVSTWSVQLPQTSLVIVRKPLDRATGDPTQEDIAVPKLSGDTIELFIRHIPADEVGRRSTRSAERPAARGRSQRTTRNAARPTAITRATHFHAFYDFLGVPRNGNRPIPETSSSPKGCVWARAVGFFPEVRITRRDSPGMLHCMLASADPQ